MVKVQIEFITSSPIDHADPSKREAIRAQVRSHAARVTYVCPHKRVSASQKSKVCRGRQAHRGSSKHDPALSWALAARTKYKRLPIDEPPDDDGSSLALVTGRILAADDMRDLFFDANDIVLENTLLSGSDAPLIDLSFLRRQSSYGTLLRDLPTESHHVFADWVHHQMAQHSDLRHTVLSTLYAREDALAGRAFSPAVYLHKGQAYLDLKQRLSTQGATSGEAWIFTVVLLGFLEVALKDRPAFEIHRKHWGDTMTRKGLALSIAPSFTTLAHMKLVEIVWYGLWSTKLEAESLPRRTLAPKPKLIPFTPEYHSEILHLPAGFQELAHHLALSSELIRTIERAPLRQHWCVSELAFLPEGPHQYASEPFLDRCILFDGSADMVWGADSDLDERSLHHSTFEKLMAMAVIRYTINRTQFQRSRECAFQKLTERLTAQLTTTPVPEHSATRNCFMWMWLMAIDSWFAVDPSSPEGARLLRAFRNTFAETHSLQARDLQKFGHRYYWTSSLDQTLKRYW